MFSKRNSNSNSPSPVAGWYPDRDDPSLLRFWDGTQWTDKLIRNDSSPESEVSKETKKLAKGVALSHKRENARLLTQKQMEQVNSELEHILTNAQTCAQSGDIQGEEKYLAEFLSTAAKAGGSVGRDNANRRIQSLVSEKSFGLARNTLARSKENTASSNIRVWKISVRFVPAVSPQRFTPTESSMAILSMQSILQPVRR